MSMLSVRLPRAMFDEVRHFTRRDGVTVSEWMRRLVEAEAASPNRYPPADIARYPQPRTTNSSAEACPGGIKWTLQTGPPVTYTT